MQIKDRKTDVDLSETDLREARLYGANLTGARLYGANLSEADIRKADLTGANLYEADLTRANFTGADLRGANFTEADLYRANLYRANLTEAKLYRANFTEANLTKANLTGADLTRANLYRADLTRADLTGAKGLKTNLEMLEKLFKQTKEGFIVYKTFGAYYEPPDNWSIEEDSVLEEEVDLDRRDKCSYGINFATLEWIENDSNCRYKPVWRCLLRKEDLELAYVPYATDGKARCGKLTLLKREKRSDS